MQVYHHTNRQAYDNMLKTGGVSHELCRKMFHPALSEGEKFAVEKPALWAFPEPHPKAWLETKYRRDGMRNLLSYTCKEAEPAERRHPTKDLCTLARAIAAVDDSPGPVGTADSSPPVPLAGTRTR